MNVVKSAIFVCFICFVFNVIVMNFLVVFTALLSPLSKISDVIGWERKLLVVLLNHRKTLFCEAFRKERTCAELGSMISATYSD